MSDSPQNDQQARTREISEYLRNQADQQIEAAERLEDQATGTRSEAAAMDEGAGRMRDRADNLQQQADNIDRAAEE